MCVGYKKKIEHKSIKSIYSFHRAFKSSSFAHITAWTVQFCVGKKKNELNLDRNIENS